MTRDEVLDALFRVFRERGFEGATISAIAKACGLGKASLYHHFPDGKDEMLLALVSTVLDGLDRDAFAPLRGWDAPKTRIRAVIDGLGRYLEGGERNCLIAVLALGTAQTRIGVLVSAHVQRWLDGLTQLYEAAGLSKKKARRAASDVLVRMQGAVVVSRMLDDVTTFRQTSKRLLRETEKL